MPNLEAPRLAHEAETAPHGASADAIAKSLALRTATGTLKAAKATANDELVNLELLNEMERKANDELTKEFKKVDDELAEIIRAEKPAINSDNFGRQEEAERGKELNKRVNETVAYHNALRNERGSLAVPEAVSDTEAVNKKQLETHVSEKIAELVDGAPGTLDTLKEIADALNGEAGIVNTLTEKITKAKEEAVQTAEEDATKKANDAQAEAVKTAKAEATQYTDSKLANYYTKAKVDESQRVQDERIATLEAARPTSGAGALYDFSKAEAVKTAKDEATQYTNSKLADYYTKADVDKSQQKQDERIKKLEAARPTSGAGALYDFSKAEAVKTAKAEATQYTDSKLADYYTKAEVNESQQKQDARIKALEDARPTSGAGALYDFAQAEAVKTAKAEATQYTDSKLADYYTKAEVNESQQKQDARIKALEDARPTSGSGALYDFSKGEAVKTGETIKLADGTVKDIYRLCVERENVQDFSVTVAETPTQIIGIKGTVQIGNTFANIYADYEIVLEANKITFFRKDTTKTYSKVFVIVDCIF